MVKNADMLVCDSKSIEKYIKEEYKSFSPKTVYISYGAEVKESNNCSSWLEEKKLRKDEYYLIVGRFVPENNYETMIREFMKTEINKDLAIITDVKDDFLRELDDKTEFRKDPRVKFVGSVYNEELLNSIRQNAYGYIHGHEVGGTNPSLLEALGATKLNLLLDVDFNREVAENAALYWTKGADSLRNLLNLCEDINREELGRKAKQRIKDLKQITNSSLREMEVQPQMLNTLQGNL